MRKCEATPSPMEQDQIGGILEEIDIVAWSVASRQQNESERPVLKECEAAHPENKNQADDDSKWGKQPDMGRVIYSGYPNQK